MLVVRISEADQGAFLQGVHHLEGDQIIVGDRGDIGREKRHGACIDKSVQRKKGFFLGYAAETGLGSERTGKYVDQGLNG